MKPEEIIKLLREGSGEVLEGLEALTRMSNKMSETAKNLGEMAQEAKKVVEMADKISRKFGQQKP